MNIQGYPDELDWVNARLFPLLGNDETSFLSTFCRAALRADSQNYEILRPAVRELMQKYPADPFQLRREREDRGANT